MRVGIVGGGQLAQMLAIAGQSLGLSFAFLDPNPEACAFSFGTAIVGHYDDHEMLSKLASESDVVTFEFENVPADSITYLQSLVQVYPPSEALRMTQDRLLEKQLLRDLGIKTVEFLPVKTFPELMTAVSQLGLPLILKARRQGYDGKGQAVVRHVHDASRIFESFNGVPLIAEALAPFTREISIFGVRSHDGEMRFYDLSVNVHHHGILQTAMASPDDDFAHTARLYLSCLMTHFNYAGVMALELFDCPTGLVANEYAPRVHNSGHWSIEGTHCSQFENHLRAICHLPLGDIESIGFPAIVNCIGDIPDPVEVKSHPHLALHNYGKPIRPGRKVGHIFVQADSVADRDSGILDALALAGKSR